MTQSIENSDLVVRILAVSGSLRQASYNRRLARLTTALGIPNVEIVEFNDLAVVEPFDEDFEHVFAPGVDAWRRAIRSVHGVFFATPEYNGSIPGQLKNALDWASRSDTDTLGTAGSALYGKPASVASMSQGQFGGAWAAEELRKILRTQGARVIDTVQVSIPFAVKAFNESGDLRDTAARSRLVQLIEATAQSARQLEIAGVSLVSAA